MNIPAKIIILTLFFGSLLCVAQEPEESKKQVAIELFSKLTSAPGELLATEQDILFLSGLKSPSEIIAEGFQKIKSLKAGPLNATSLNRESKIMFTCLSLAGKQALGQGSSGRWNDYLFLFIETLVNSMGIRPYSKFTFSETYYYALLNNFFQFMANLKNLDDPQALRELAKGELSALHYLSDHLGLPDLRRPLGGFKHTYLPLVLFNLDFTADALYLSLHRADFFSQFLILQRLRQEVLRTYQQSTEADFGNDRETARIDYSIGKIEEQLELKKGNAK
jgi:hypothetical protein